jgi:hypothetical protein
VPDAEASLLEAYGAVNLSASSVALRPNADTGAAGAVNVKSLALPLRAEKVTSGAVSAEGTRVLSASAKPSRSMGGTKDAVPDYAAYVVPDYGWDNGYYGSPGYSYAPGPLYAYAPDAYAPGYVAYGGSYYDYAPGISIGVGPIGVGIGPAWGW